MLRFYSDIGLQFETVQVSKGGQYYKSYIGAIEFMIYGVAQAERAKYPACQFSIEVDNIETVVTKLSQIEGVSIVLDPILLADGWKAVLMDPDGHSVELISK